ncbi:MAG: acetate uptake transporter, partial [Frankiaceae bacterium]
MATEAVHGQVEEVRVELPQQRPPAQTELVVTTRPSPAETIADPGPLGLACFALTTFVLSIFNAGLFDQTTAMKPVYLSIALVYGGVAQMLAGMWEFKKNNTFGAVAFTSYGAFWVSLALFVKFWGPAMKASAAGDAGYETALGIFLLSWTIFTAYMLVGSFRT